MMEDKKKLEVLAQAGETMGKIMLGFVPGGHVFDAFMNFRGDLKSKRVISFLEQFQLFLESHLNRPVKESDFTNENFSDVFEQIISKVQHTKSKVKLERFKVILAKQVITVNADEFITNKYTQIVDELNEVELSIMDKLCNAPKKIQQRDLFNKIGSVRREKIPDTTSQFWNVVDLEVGTFVVAVDTGQMDFYINNLISKGLLEKRMKTDKEMLEEHKLEGLATFGGEFTIAKKDDDVYYLISDFARTFIKYVQDMK